MRNAPAQATVPMSEPLEDYLETIYLLVQEHGAARVRDIAKARGVRAATVSIALGKLSGAKLVNYARRESVSLTGQGEDAARRVFSRHRLLTRLFGELLGMSPREAGAQACSMEHSLTDEAMDRLVRFFEFVGGCPSVVEAFARCPLGTRPGDDGPCASASPACAECTARSAGSAKSVASLKPGQSAVVTRIRATGARRRRLLDQGILPETAIGVERDGAGGRALWIRCQGARLALRQDEAASVLVRHASETDAPDAEPESSRAVRRLGGDRPGAGPRTSPSCGKVGS